MAGRIPGCDLEEQLRGIGLEPHALRNPEQLLGSAVRQVLLQQFTEGLPSYRRKASVQLLGSANHVRAYHRMTYTKFKSVLRQGNVFASFSSTYSNKIYPSKNPFKCLERVSILDLYLDEAATGKYLLLRTIEPSYNQMSITTVVEDHVGNVTLFSAYNLVADPTVSANDMLPPGLVFILKEPYFKVPKIGNCMLRSDCPSDIIILRPSHPLHELTIGCWRNTVNSAGVIDLLKAPPKLTTCESWKKRGHELFNDGKVSHAAECYRMSLKEVECTTNKKEMRIVQLCLSTAYIRLERFEAGLKSAQHALQLKPKCAKGLFRAGRACYELRRYKEALGYFEKFSEISPTDPQAKTELARSRKRVLEESGQFNVCDLLVDSVLHPGKTIDCADYVGPVEVVKLQAACCYRSVVATADIEPGTLLVVSKALKATWDTMLERCVQLNSNMTVDAGNNMRLVAEVAEAIWKNPNTFGQMVYSLLESTDEPVPLFCDPETEEEPIIHVDKLRNIISLNAFSLSSTWGGLQQNIYRGGSEDGCGLFVFPSFFRHSCLPNATRCTFGDVLVIRAIRSIRAGQEVFINYLRFDSELEERQTLSSRLGYHCSCHRCELDRSESASWRQTRHEVLSRCNARLQPKIKNNEMLSLDDLHFLQQCILEAEDVYANAQRTEWKVDLVTYYHLLGLAHHSQGSYADEVQAYFKALQCFGFARKPLALLAEGKDSLQMLNTAYLNRCVLDILVQIILAYHCCGRQSQAQKWVGVLKVLERLLTGGNLAFIKLKYDLIRAILD